MRPFQLCLSILTCLLLAACGNDHPQEASVTRASDAHIAEVISSPPWLRSRLPEEAIAYLRVPSPWGLLTAPDGRTHDLSLANAAHVEAIDALRRAVGEELGVAAVPAWLRLLHRLASPIEVAALAPGRMASPATQAYATVAVVTDDPDELHAWLLESLLPILPAAAALPSFDATGHAELEIGSARAALRFDAATSRLHLLVGSAANTAALGRLLQSLDGRATEPHRMQRLEQETDAHGQGLVAWIDVKSLMPVLAAGLSEPEHFAVRQALAQTEAVAFGFGTVNGRGRLGLRIHAPAADWLDWLPRSPKRSDLSAVGEPRWMLMLGLPTEQDYARLRTALERDLGSEAVAGLRRMETQFRDHLGVSPEELLGALGPALIAFGDDAGDFTGIEVRDHDVLARLLERAKALPGAAYRVRTVGSGRLHHLTMPSWLAAIAASDGPLARLGDHLFWLEEGDGWLVFASIPQPLRDRARAATRRKLGDWHTEQLGADPGQAVLAGAVRMNGSTRSAYHGYLAVLHVLGDLAGRPFDVFDLPSARELGLPGQSSLGLMFRADDEGTALQLGYGTTLLESMYGGQAMTTVAVLGIVTAIAVPAYQDYTARAHVNQRLAAAQPWKVQIAEAYFSTGRVPGYQAFPPATGFPVELAEGIRYLDDGSIEIDVDRTVTREAGILRLHPSMREDGLHWQCESTLNPRLLPVACR